MHNVVAHGTAVVSPKLAHSVHVEVDGLKPGRDYFYQFDVRDEESRVGHFRTAPGPQEMASQIRFAFATCQDWPSGYYTAYRDMVQNDLDRRAPSRRLHLRIRDRQHHWARHPGPGWLRRSDD